MLVAPLGGDGGKLSDYADPSAKWCNECHNKRHGSHEIGGPDVNLENFTTAQKNINNSIFEYLMKFGYSRAIEVLKSEISSQKGIGYLQRSMVQDDSQSINYMV